MSAIEPCEDYDNWVTVALYGPVEVKNRPGTASTATAYMAGSGTARRPPSRALFFRWPDPEFDPESREGAVRIVLESGRPIAQAAEDLDVTEGSVGNWVPSPCLGYVARPFVVRGR